MERKKRDEIVEELEAQGYEVIVTLHSGSQATRMLIELASAGGYTVTGYSEESMVCRKETDKTEEISIIKKGRMQYYLVKKTIEKVGT